MTGRRPDYYTIFCVDIGVTEVTRNSRIPTKVILDGLKRNMSRGNSLSDELELSSVLGDTRVLSV